MVNLRLDIKDNILTITVDLSQEHGQSKSGESVIVSNSGGNLRLVNPDGSFRLEQMNLSIFRKIPREQRRRW